MHERHVRRTASGKGNQIGSTCTNGVRQRAMRVDSSHGLSAMASSNNSNNNNNNSNVPPPPMSTGRPAARASSVLFDALAHPAQAAAVAAAASNQPPRGRKRKTASMVLLTVLCGAVVYYSGTLYDVDVPVPEYFLSQDEGGGAAKGMPPRGRRAARLRSRSSVHVVIPDSKKEPVSTFQRLIGNNNNNNLAAEAAITRKENILRERIVNTLKAAFVADAASMGTHWIYKLDDLNRLLPSKTKPEFRNPPVPNFYSEQQYPGHYGPGQASPYGEQLMFVAQYAASLANQQPRLPHSKYDDDDGSSRSSNDPPGSILEPMSQAMQDWLQSYGGRSDHASLQFLSCRQQRLQDGEAAQQQHNDEAASEGEGEDDESNSILNNTDEPVSCGADDDQAHFFLKVIPMTCLYVGHPHRRDYVEQAIRVHQNNDQAVLFGLTISDLLERVLLMDDNSSNNSNGEASSDGASLATMIMGSDVPYQSAKSLREALDVTLVKAQEDHSDSWFHFADSFTQEHQQREALIDSWVKAKDAAEQQQSSEKVAAIHGRSCYMPGALIVSLHGLYRAANTPETTASPDDNTAEKKTSASSTTGQDSQTGYNYFSNFKALFGGTIQSATGTTGQVAPTKENTLYMMAIRQNILAAGDTCSRAILMGAVLGAAYGQPPEEWWQKLYPVLSGQVEEVAYTIANFAVRRLQR